MNKNIILSKLEEELTYNIFQSTATNTGNDDDSSLTLEKLKNIVKFLDEKFPKKERFSGIIITNIYSPPSGAYRVNVKNGFYIFVRKSIWESWKLNFSVTHRSDFVPYFVGIPVREDEALAKEIFEEAIKLLTKTVFSDIILP